MKATFILPGRGGGGGAHSVVQESQGLKRLGVDVAVATTTDTIAAFHATYPELTQLNIPTPLFLDARELAAAIEGADIAIATAAPSANLLAEALELMDGQKPRPAYYIQDYEPLFFTPGTPEWRAARDSYSALKDPLLFAKTEWLCWIVEQNHNRRVVKVLPSIDHVTFHPGARPPSDRIVLSAMIRPKTARRAPQRTARLLDRIAAEFGDSVTATSFGCEPGELQAAAISLSPRVEHAGTLSRRQVAALLRASDLFLDLSDFQAFGRTGLEGMACGCVPVLPIFGGAGEYVRHRENAYLVDTRSDEAILELVREYIGNRAGARAEMRRRAIATALDYSIERAAFSEYEAFERYLD